MTAAPLLPDSPRSRGIQLDRSPEAFGQLTASDATQLSDPELQQRLDSTGYLYLPGLFTREEVLDVRYQSAKEPVDERFVGAGPLGHVGAAKRGRIC